jgi:hypothetical protein
MPFSRSAVSVPTRLSNGPYPYRSCRFFIVASRDAASDSGALQWMLVHSTDGSNMNYRTLAQGEAEIINGTFAGHGANEGLTVYGIAPSYTPAGYIALWLNFRFTGEKNPFSRRPRRGLVYDDLKWTFTKGERGASRFSRFVCRRSLSILLAIGTLQLPSDLISGCDVGLQVQRRVWLLRRRPRKARAIAPIVSAILLMSMSSTCPWVECETRDM